MCRKFEVLYKEGSDGKIFDLKNLKNMKKIFYVLAFLGLFTFLTPKVASSAEGDCYTVEVACVDDPGTIFYIMICEVEDWQAWSEILCGTASN